MIELYRQPYQNVIRTISGVINAVSQDDYLLLCDTSTGAVVVDLPTIPANYWSTQWKISIVDSSYNASVNSITINAPVGYTINGQSSAVITSNGAGYIIMVSSNTNYAGLYSGVISGTTTTQLISITNAGLLALATAGTIGAGQFYFITDVSNVSSANGEGVAVQGIKVNGYSTILGSGSFFNADYQGLGNYSGVSNYVNNVGIWSVSAPPSFVQFSIAIYNNLHYQNTTGAWSSTPPNLDAVNWTLLPKSKTNGYILVQDAVKYDILNNVVVYRADDKNNEVDRYVSGGYDSLLNFQWGRNVVKNNKLRGNSLMKTTNSYCSFDGNILENGTLQDETGYNLVSAGAYNGNTIIEGSSVTMLLLNPPLNPSGNGRNAGTIANNHFGNGVTIRFTEIATGISFTNNTMEVVNSNLGNLTTSISNKRCVSGFSNFERTILADNSPLSYWKNFVLTIDTKYTNENNWVGIFYLLKTADSIHEIVNLPTNHPCTFYTAVGSTPFLAKFLITAKSGVGTNEIVGASNQFPLGAGGNYTLNEFTTNQGADFMVIQKQGTINQAINYTSIL